MGVSAENARHLYGTDIDVRLSLKCSDVKTDIVYVVCSTTHSLCHCNHVSDVRQPSINNRRKASAHVNKDVCLIA